MPFADPTERPGKRALLSVSLGRSQRRQRFKTVESTSKLELHVQWERHESMRQSIVGPASPLWNSWQGSQVALTLLASIPHGGAEIVKARTSVQSELIAPPWGYKHKITSPLTSRMTHVSVGGGKGTFGFPAESIYIGKPVGAVQATPWTDPTLFISGVNFWDYCNARADVGSWLLHLAGKD